MMYDLLIVGAGPAGLTAAIYARRAGRSVLILEKGGLGGQMTFSPKIENYPGYPVLSGMELADKMAEQALNLGAEVEIDTILSAEDKGDYKLLHGEFADYEGRTLILATGAKHRLLGVPGESELVGSGISFCAVCDGAFFENKEVLVIGGGNSALQEAVLLAKTCKKVTVVQNLAVLTGERSLAGVAFPERPGRICLFRHRFFLPTGRGTNFHGALYKRTARRAFLRRSFRGHRTVTRQPTL